MQGVFMINFQKYVKDLTVFAKQVLTEAEQVKWKSIKPILAYFKAIITKRVG